MPAWLIVLLTDLIKEGATTIPQIVAIGQANGMTPEEEAAITAGLEEMIARREKVAAAPPVDPPAGQ
jgi:hypothetical protein